MPKIGCISSRVPVICTACPLRWRFAASNPDLILRELRIRILSGCVGGFSIPKIRPFSCEHAPAKPNYSVLSITFSPLGLRDIINL